MLEREVITQDLEKKHIDLVQRFGTDLRDVLEIFKTMKDHPMIGRNMPPVAGAVLWIRGLKERIRDPFDRFKTIHASTVGSLFSLSLPFQFFSRILARLRSSFVTFGR